MLKLAPNAGRWLARSLALTVPVAVVAGSFAGVAEAAPKKAPIPVVTVKPANPTNDTTGTFAWQQASGVTYSCALDKAQRAQCPGGKFAAPSNLADGLHTFTIRSTQQGTKASNWSWSWRVDTVPPAAPSITPPPAYTSNTEVSVSFHDTDTSVARFTCAVDSQAAAACTNPFTKSGFAEGAHSLTVTAYDAAGNSAAATVKWTVDHTAPDIPVVVSPPSPTNATSASITFEDSTATSFTCALDGAAATSCVSPLPLTGLAEGAHQVVVTAYDAAGNHTSNSAAWTIDTTPPPAPSMITGPAAVTDDTSPVVQFSDLDPSGVTFACTVRDMTTGTDVQTDSPCVSPYVISAATTDLDHYRLMIVPTDGAGNQGPADISVAWQLDLSQTPSPAQFVQAPASPSNDPSPTFGFVAPDAGQTGGATGFLCSLDGASFASCGGTASATTASTYAVGSVLPEGPHTFAVETSDGTNTSDPITWSWTVDTTPPAAATVSAPDPSVVNPTITFSSSDTNVTYLCSIDGGAPVPCSSPWTPPAGLANGPHTLVVETVDAAGNTTASPQVTFTTQATPSTAPAGGPVPSVTGVAVPTTLTGPAVVSFSETVSGLAPGLVRLTVAGAGGSVPTTTTCLSGSTAVACSATFGSVRLTPTAPLVLGQHYVVVADAGAVHDASGTPSTAASTAFRAARTAEEGDPTVHAAWSSVHNRAAYGGSFVQEHLAGASASWTFAGTAVTWWTVTGPTMGKANVYVDGVRKATVDNYAAATKFHVGRVIKGLANKRHTLVVKVLGIKGAKAGKGTFVAVDAFTVGKTRTATPALTTTLRTVSSSRFFGSRASVGDVKGETITVAFRGTSIAFATVKGANQGKVAAYVDGALKATFDDYAAATSYRVQRSIGHLADKLHTLKLVVLGAHHKGGKGNLVTVDRFTVG